MQIKITTAYAILAALATTHAAPITARGLPLLDSANLNTGGQGEAAGGLLNVLDINKVTNSLDVNKATNTVDVNKLTGTADVDKITSNADVKQVTGPVDALNVGKVANSLNPDKNTADVNHLTGAIDALNVAKVADSLNSDHNTIDTKTHDNTLDIPIKADHANVEALTADALNNASVKDAVKHNDIDTVVKDNHVHDVHVGDVKPVNVEAKNNNIANGSANNIGNGSANGNKVLTDNVSPKIANDSANGNASHNDSHDTKTSNVDTGDIKNIDIIKGNHDNVKQDSKPTANQGGGGSGGSGGNGQGVPHCTSSDCSIMQEVKNSLIGLDIKDIKVDKVDLDVLGKVSHLLALYPKKQDFAHDPKPLTVDKGKVLPPSTFECGSHSGASGAGPAAADLGKLISRTDTVDLCILAGAYDKRPAGSIACPGEMQHDPLKKLLTTRDMDESNANDGSWDVLESPQDGSAEMERRRLNIDGDIKLCLLDKKH